MGFKALSISFLLATFTSLLFLRTDALTDSDARSISVYQLITDRFAIGNGSTPACDTSDRVYCGGNWQGIVNHLDYIQGMGFDAIWISPIVANIGGTTAEGQSYHGYWTLDIDNLNSNFGSEDDLKSLVKAVQGKGMKIICDVVINHVAATANSNFAPSDSYGPFSTSDDFHPFCWITDYNNQTNVEQCWLGDTNVALPDLNTESDYVVSTWTSWISNLTSTYGFDALRIDTVKHIRKDFWPGFVQSAGVWAVGEVLDGDPAYVAQYQNQSMNSTFNYPIYYPLIAAFNSTSGDIPALVTALQTNRVQFRDTTLLGNFLDNHDNPRFESTVTDSALIKNAAIFPFAIEGIPFVYQGQEQGYTGGADPANREALWLSGFNTNSTMYTFFKTLNSIRSTAASNNTSYNTQTASILTSNSNDMAILKSPVLTVLTNRGSSAEDTTLSVPTGNTSWSDGQQLVDVLSCSSANVSGSSVTLPIGAGQPGIWMPSSMTAGFCGSTLAKTGASRRDVASLSGVGATFGVLLLAWVLVL